MHEGAVDVASVRSRGCREQRHGKISVGNKGTRGFRAEPNTPNLTVTSVVVRGRGNNDRNRFKCDGDPDGHRIGREKEHPRRVAVNRFSNKTEYTCFITECRPRHERLLRYVRPLRFDCQTRHFSVSVAKSRRNPFHIFHAAFRTDLVRASPRGAPPSLLVQRPDRIKRTGRHIPVTFLLISQFIFGTTVRVSPPILS